MNESCYAALLLVRVFFLQGMWKQGINNLIIKGKRRQWMKRVGISS